MAGPPAGHRHSRRGRRPPASAATSAPSARAPRRNFDGPIQTIIPWAGNLYTETLIRRARAEFGDDFWGFWMLGGMSGGGMGFLFEPARKAEAQERLQAIMSETKRAMEHAVPFAMEPVVYDFAINERGTQAGLLQRRRRPDAGRLLHAGRAAAAAHRSRACSPPDAAPNSSASPPPAAPRPSSPAWCRISSTTCCRAPQDRQTGRDAEPGSAARTLTGSTACSTSRSRPTCAAAASAWRRIACRSPAGSKTSRRATSMRLRLPARYRETRHAGAGRRARWRWSRWPAASGSRWTKGAGVVKALNPFCKLGGRHRNFIEVHLAKSRRVGRECGTLLPHVVTTSYLTHDADRAASRAAKQLRLPRAAAALARAASSACA